MGKGQNRKSSYLENDRSTHRRHYAKMRKKSRLQFHSGEDGVRNIRLENGDVGGIIMTNNSFEVQFLYVLQYNGTGCRLLE